MCPQCGTREDEWQDEDGNTVDAYVASSHLCLGCKEITRKQAEIPEEASAGMKVLLIPPSVHAALMYAKDHSTTSRKH